MKNAFCRKSIRQVRRAYALFFLTVLRLFHSRNACDRSAQVVCADIRALFHMDGAGLDEDDGLARPSAAEGRGRARNVPDTCVFFVSCTSYRYNEP